MYLKGEKVIFDLVKNELKKSVPNDEFSRYISQLTYAEDESFSDCVCLNAPNPYIAAWVQTKYASKIAGTFQELNGTTPQVIIKIKHPRARTVISADDILQKEIKTAKSTLLNPSYTFESFVIGRSNDLAFSVAKAVCENPDVLYNPVFIHGGVGLGKTHLLQAIGNAAVKNNKHVIYSTCDQFTNEFIFHINNHSMERFRDKYRHCDFFLIDDVQFLSTRESTQEEFFNTFNDLHNDKKQIVLTADKNPKLIAGLEERLKSRFMWGMIADIQRPDLETKIAIIKKKCEIDQIKISDEIVNYIATILEENIREIEGALIRIRAYANMLNQAITIDFVKDTLKDYIKEKHENITIEEIITTVAKELNCKPSEIRSKSRTARIVNARRMVIFLAHKLTQNSMRVIAEYFEMKDHSAVSHSLRTISQIIASDAGFKLKIDELSSKITSVH